MLNKENYVPWSSRLLRYAKSRPNEKLIYNSIINDDELTKKELKQVEADDQAIQTILLDLPEDIYAAVDSCKSASEIWFTSTDGESIESYYHHFSKLMNDLKRNKYFPGKIASNLKFLNNLQPEWSGHVTIVHQIKDLHTSDYTQLYDFLKYNQKEVDDLRAERLVKIHDPLALMANSKNPFNYLVFHPNQPSPIPDVRIQVVQNAVLNPASNVGNQNGLIVVPGIANQIQKECCTEQTREGMLLIFRLTIIDIRYSDCTKLHVYEFRRIRLRYKPLDNCYNIDILDRSLKRSKADESLAKHKALELEIERLLRAVVSQDIMSIVQSNSVVDTSNLQTELERKPPSSSGSKIYAVTPFLKSKGLPKIDETHALSKPVTSNSVPTQQESKVMKNEYVIAPGMFRINPFKPSREAKSMPNKVKESIRTNPITISQPHVIIKKGVNSNLNGLSSTGVGNTAKTRRPQPRSNTKNDRIPSASKSSCIKNKEVEVEEHLRNLLLSKNKKHVSSECNNIKLSIRNDKSKVVCAMCKQCLITANHDVCVLNYVNDMNSHGKKQKANILNTENQKKQKPKVMKPKKVGSNERLASPKPSKPRSCLRWLPTGILFDLKGKIIKSNKSESQSDYSKGDNACITNPQEPTRKRFPNSTFSLVGHSNLFMVSRRRMLKAHDRKSKASHKFCLEVLGNRPLWK
ncbi:hypothetical protein Tco_0536155 [Tanacetum coccineum]